MPSPAETLLATLSNAESWPPDPAWGKVADYAAFREADEACLRRMAKWERLRPYIPDPLPWLIAKSGADLLFGEIPDIEPADDADCELLEAIVEGSDLPTYAHRAAQIASSEGEVWWHVFTDRAACDVPMIEFVSRSQVFSLWRGQHTSATAFVSVVRKTQADEVWRHLEVHEPGVVHNRLYIGSSHRLGREVALTRDPSLADVEPVWKHGLGVPLCGRILNKPADPMLRLGRSDYAGVESMFLALDEATAIGVENARLTAKKRLFISGKYLDGRGNFPAGDDVLHKDDLDGADGDKSSVSAVEYSFDADQLIQWTRDLTDRIVTRCGLVPQWVGATVSGQAETGTALRVRLIPATLTAQGKAHHFRAGLSDALLAAQMIDAMPTDQGGFARPWKLATERPAIEMADPLPRDSMEDAQRLSILASSELQSRRRSVSELHPDFDSDQVDEELLAIEQDVSGTMPAPAPDPQGTMPADPVDSHATD